MRQKFSLFNTASMGVVCLVAIACSGGITVIENPFDRQVSCNQNILQKSCQGQVSGSLQFMAQAQSSSESEYFPESSIRYSLNGIDGAKRIYEISYSQKPSNCPSVPKIKAKMDHSKSTMDISYYNYPADIPCDQRAGAETRYSAQGVLVPTLGASSQVKVDGQEINLSKEGDSSQKISIRIQLNYDLDHASVISRDLYPDDYKIYIAGVPTADLAPAFLEDVKSWAVEPALPAGLNFNSNSGVLSGSPVSIFTETEYQITAKREREDRRFSIFLRSIDPTQALVVNSNEDPASVTGDCNTVQSRCTLRGAIAKLAAQPAFKNYIYLPAPFELTLTQGQLNLSADYQILGAQASLTRINGDSKFKIFHLQASDKTYQFIGMTLINGLAIRGGAIAHNYQNARLIIDRMKFENNRARSGGAVFISGGIAATVTHSSFVGNIATAEIADTDNSGSAGGAVFTNSAYTMIENCLFRGNISEGGAGSAVRLSGGDQVEINDSIFYDNVGRHSSNSSNVGGTVVLDSGALKLNNSVIYKNAASGTYSAGGIQSFTSSVFKVTDSIIAENSGPRNNCDAGVNSMGGNLVYPPEPDCRFNNPTDLASAVPNLLAYFGIGL